jgi:two-component system LytT family response regulator
VIKAVIVEDEEKSLINLRNMLANECPQVEIIGEARKVEEAVDLLSDPAIKPDVAFLDIRLPDGLVFQLLNQVKPVDFEVIFVTAFDQYAIRACEYSSIGYILKPIDPDRLKDAVSRIRPRQNNQIESRLDVFTHAYNNPNAFTKLSVFGLDGIYFVNIKDVIRLEAEDNYTHIFLHTGERITASKTIKSYEDLLVPLNFFRVHKRHIINLNFMRKFVRTDGYIVMEDAAKIEVSRRRRPAFIDQMRKLQQVY